MDDVISKLTELNAQVDKARGLSANKNSQIHLMIETSVLDSMKKRAAKENISLSEWCRKKLREDSQLDRIEKLLMKTFKP